MVEQSPQQGRQGQRVGDKAPQALDMPEDNPQQKAPPPADTLNQLAPWDRKQGWYLPRNYWDKMVE